MYSGVPTREYAFPLSWCAYLLASCKFVSTALLIWSVWNLFVSVWNRNSSYVSNEAKICKFDVPINSYQYIIRLYISVNKPQRVNVFNSLYELSYVEPDLILRERISLN